MTVEAKIAESADTAEAAAKDAEKRLHALVERLEKGVQEVLDLVRSRSKVYAEGASEQLDTAQKYVTERVQEKPLTATLAALGAGLVIGVLLSGRNR
jgi:ElaB/YqjD/DUF883 family membrane-anchored ribosome-binding protein